MRFSALAMVITSACSSNGEAARPRPNAPSLVGAAVTSDAAARAAPAPDGQQVANAVQPGGTGVDEHGNLLRSRPDPNEPRPDPALVGNHEANLLYFAGAIVNDHAILLRVWRQLGLVDVAGTPTPRMSDFIRAHQQWSRLHVDRAQVVNTPPRARAYLDAHLR